MNKIEKIIQNVNENNQNKVDWTKAWSTKYPILKKYQKERNLTIIMITHNLENTLYSDRIVVLNNGNIYLDGSVKDVYSSNKINSLKLDLPFVIKLSNKLINEHIINKVYTNTIDLMEDLWP